MTANVVELNERLTRVVAVGASDPWSVARGTTLRLGYRPAAGFTERVGAWLELRINADALIEDETLSLPATVVRLDLLEIAEDPSA